MIEYTAQQAFDVVWQHAERLPKQSRGYYPGNSGVEFCAYRSDNGGKCFIGALIADADYDKSLEGLAVSRLLNRVIRISGMTETSACHFLGDLQRAHDSTSMKPGWFRSLRSIAKEYNLKCPN